MIRLMREKLDGRIMKEPVVLRPSIYGYLTDDGYVNEKFLIKR